jgi:hypothetical protein
VTRNISRYYASQYHNTQSFKLLEDHENEQPVKASMVRVESQLSDYQDPKSVGAGLLPIDPQFSASSSLSEATSACVDKNDPRKLGPSFYSCMSEEEKDYRRKVMSLIKLKEEQPTNYRERMAKIKLELDRDYGPYPNARSIRAFAAMKFSDSNATKGGDNCRKLTNQTSVMELDAMELGSLYKDTDEGRNVSNVPAAVELRDYAEERRRAMDGGK